MHMFASHLHRQAARTRDRIQHHLTFAVRAEFQESVLQLTELYSFNEEQIDLASSERTRIRQ